MADTYPKNSRTKAGSPVVILGTINGMLFGAWCESTLDGQAEWYASKWDASGKSHVGTAEVCSLDLESV